jgi:hypothetical protein
MTLESSTIRHVFMAPSLAVLADWSAYPTASSGYLSAFQIENRVDVEHHHQPVV